MLKLARSRLTYANVMATVAVFLALGGGAYALTGIPDRSGVYHGCVDGKTSVLRVVKAASACRKTKTVRRGNRRVRIPGESAIAWSQQGPRGLQGQGIQGPQGLQGNTGLKGDKGDQGPVGPTQGFVAPDAAGANPSTTPDSGDIFDDTMTTSASGKLFVFARGDVQVNCSAGTFVKLGIYVDGVPVHASGQVVTAAALTETSMWGLSDTVSAGPHLVEVASDCGSGNTTGTTVSGDAAVGGIFVGS